jgi:hypothetical protein
MQKDITFVPSSKKTELSVPMPSPAKFYIPDWYKKFATFYDADNKSYLSGSQYNEDGKLNPGTRLTAKVCIPFLETFTFGYIQQTWCDISVSKKEDEVSFSVNRESEEIEQMVSTRENALIPKELIPEDCHDVSFQWFRHWNPVLPKGYSALITHPLNREDLPFRTISGIIDHDKYYLGGAVAFFMKKNFSGEIPKGTPMYQIIPFKRDDWQIKNSIDNNLLIKSMEDQISNVTSGQKGVYKKKYWQRKDFN